MLKIALIAWVYPLFNLVMFSLGTVYLMESLGVAIWWHVFIWLYFMFVVKSALKDQHLKYEKRLKKEIKYERSER